MVQERDAAAGPFHLEQLVRFGHALTTLKSKSPYRHIHAADIAAILQGKIILDSSFTVTRQDGSPLSVEISGAPWLDNDGQPAGVVTIVRDATLRRRAEAEIKCLNESLEKRVEERTADLQRKSHELKESKAALVNLVEDLNERTCQLEAANEKLKDLDRLKSLFIASMSHELRTPLNSIIGFSSILLNEWIGPLTAEQKQNLDSVLRSGKHLLALINDVIDVTKIEAGKSEVVAADFDLHAHGWSMGNSLYNSSKFRWRKLPGRV